MTVFDVVVPALTIQTSDGSIDFAATRRYAERAAATWVDYLILSGSTTRGDLLTPDERAAIIDLWLDVAEPARLLPCCWEPADIEHAVTRMVTPMAVLQHRDHVSALQFIRELPTGTAIYSHPMFGGTVFDAALARDARAANVLPVGGKLAKINTDQVRTIREATGNAFQLWDGSSRRIAASVRAGATGIVATPLSPFGENFPAKDTAAIQLAVDPIQSALDSLATRMDRTKALIQQATSAI
ncbi:hypothetical protein ACW2Q0_17415 [Nocardia sp. R16R-3T]